MKVPYATTFQHALVRLQGDIRRFHLEKQLESAICKES